MKITFLGTASAGGVPRFGCTCAACVRARIDHNFKRRPCSALIEHDNTCILIDAGLMDLHECFTPEELDAIVLTHFHPDHVQGLFHLRWGRGTPIAVYTPPDRDGCADLYKNPGILKFSTLHKFQTIQVGTLRFTPLPLTHSKITFGYAIEDQYGTRFAYLTDTIGLPDETVNFLKLWGVFDMAIDCSHPPTAKPRNHNDWMRAHHCAQQTGARITWLTHIDHELDAWIIQHHPKLPPHIRLAQDGECIVWNQSK